MATYTITVDDQDRSDAPDRPWTAMVLDSDGEMLGAGDGATPALAVLNALPALDSEGEGS